MPQFIANKCKWLVTITIVLLISFFRQRTNIQFAKFVQMLKTCHSHDEEKEKAPSINLPSELQMNISKIFKEIEESMPKVILTNNWTSSSSGKNSKGFILNPKDKYCVGDVLTIQYDMYDHLGNRKKYGGDFLRPRIFTRELQAGATGRIEDFNNGTYHLHFTLFWEGAVQVSTLLFHPSEGIAALWRSRHEGLGVLAFQGRYKNLTNEAVTDCGFKLETESELCEYIDYRDEEAFYCVKQPHFPCGALKDMHAINLFSSYLSPEEQKMFVRSNVGVQIPLNFDHVDVVNCNVNLRTPTEKCRTGMDSPFPSGYFLHNRWYPLFCNMVEYKHADNFTKCLKGKRLFLIGDSTLRQYIMYFTEFINIVKYFDHHQSGWTGWMKTLLAINMDKDILVSYKRHGFPLESFDFYLFREDKYTARQIDEQGGGAKTIFVITMGQHFRQFPLQMYIKRALNIRKAIERLFIRSPDTKVIIKTENTRQIHPQTERLSDFHGYCQYLVMKEVFKGLNIGFVDAFDMSYALATGDVHPPLHVLENIMSLTFTYAC